MVASCCVYGCTTRFLKESGVGFFRVPRDINRRLKWITALRRKNWVPSYDTRICSKHFITGKPAELKDTENPDWVPSLNLGYDWNEDKRKKHKRQSIDVQNGESSLSSNIDSKPNTDKFEIYYKKILQSVIPKEEKMDNTTYPKSETAQDNSATISEDEPDCDPLTYYVHGLKFSNPSCDVTHESAFQSAKTLLMHMESQNDTDLADIVVIRRYMRKLKDKIKATEM